MAFVSSRIVLQSCKHVQDAPKEGWNNGLGATPPAGLLWKPGVKRWRGGYCPSRQTPPHSLSQTATSRTRDMGELRRAATRPRHAIAGNVSHAQYLGDEKIFLRDVPSTTPPLIIKPQLLQFAVVWNPVFPPTAKFVILVQHLAQIGNGSAEAPDGNGSVNLWRCQIFLRCPTHPKSRSPAISPPRRSVRRWERWRPSMGRSRKQCFPVPAGRFHESDVAA